LRDGAVEFDLDNGDATRANNAFQTGFGAFLVHINQDTFNDTPCRRRVELHGPGGLLTVRCDTVIDPGRYEFSVSGSAIRFRNIAGGTPIDLQAMDPTPSAPGPLVINVNEDLTRVDNLVLTSGLPIVDDFNRSDSPVVGNGWSEYEPGGIATIDGNVLRLTSGFASQDGVKVFRSLPRQNGLKITGRIRIMNDFSRVWVMVRADGTTSLRNGLGFNWRLNQFDNQLHICDNTGDNVDCLVGDVSRSNLPFSVGQTVAFEMLVHEDNAVEVRLWDAAGARPSASTLSAGPRSPVASGSNLAILESTRDGTLGDLIIDDIEVLSYAQTDSAFADFSSTNNPSGN